MIERVLRDYAAIPYAHGELVSQTVFDSTNNHYLVVVFGTDGKRRVHGCLLHVDLVDSKVWVQRDGTELGIAREPVQGGIPATDVILAHRGVARPYSEFLAA